MTHPLKKSLDALVSAIRDGVDYIRIEAGGDPPKVIPARCILHINDEGNAGPTAFKTDGVLDVAYALYLHEETLPLKGEIIAKMARDGAFILITCGASFRAWFHHLDRLGVLDRAYVYGTTDPTRRADA
jgi:hypothetical protein